MSSLFSKPECWRLTSFLVIQKNTLGIDGVLAGQELLRLTPDGKVGIGTTEPSTSLHVAGNLTLDPGTSPVLYTGTGNSEQNRYLQLINAPNATSASGLKAGGILIADGYDFASRAFSRVGPSGWDSF
jgi:hypothetical protein